MNTDTEDKFAHARENAKSWLQSIEDMIERHEVATEQAIHGPDETECTCREIEESVLEVAVRDGWHSPGQPSQDGAEEFYILLTTGGPALRIFGELNEHCEPSRAELQMQEWSTGWERYPAPEATLLSFAQCFYFGE